MRAAVASRSKLGSYVGATLVLAVLCITGPAHAQFCAGDCDGDGEVTIDEILRSVGIALDQLPLATCVRADLNGNGAVEVDEIITAINRALLGCPLVERETATPTVPATRTPTGASPTPTRTPTASPTSSSTPGPATPTPTPSLPLAPTSSRTPSPGVTPNESSNARFVAGRAALLSNVITALDGVISSLTVSVNALNVVDPSAGSTVLQCPLGGISNESCSEGTSTVSLTLAAQGCGASGPAGGATSFSGPISLQGPGFCPVPFSGNYTIGESINMVAQGSTLAVNADLSGALSMDVNASRACLITAITGTFNGSLQSTFASGSGSVIDFDRTSFRFSAPTYNFDCVAQRFTITLNGSATVRSASSSDSFDVVFRNLTVTRDARSLPVTTTYEGSIDSNCVGNPVSVQTVAALEVSAGELCPRDGKLKVTGDSVSIVYYRGDGSVELDTNNDGLIEQRYTSCLASTLLACGS